MPKPGKKPPAKRTARAAADRPAAEPDDPWVMLLAGFVRDQPLPLTGQIAEVQVHPPGARMRRSQAVELGIDDYVIVDGPEVEVEGFRMVLTPVESKTWAIGGIPLGTEGMTL